MSRILLWVLLVVLVICLCACRQDTAPSRTPAFTTPDPTAEPAGIIDEAAPLISRASSREEAQEVAQLYGITLLDFSHGAALYHTEEDPREVIRRGRENGWPELTLNYIRTPSNP